MTEVYRFIKTKFCNFQFMLHLIKFCMYTYMWCLPHHQGDSRKWAVKLVKILLKCTTFLTKNQNLPEMYQEFPYIFYTFFKNLPEMEEKSPWFLFQTHHMYVYMHISNLNRCYKPPLRYSTSILASTGPVSLCGWSGFLLSGADPGFLECVCVCVGGGGGGGSNPSRGGSFWICQVLQTPLKQRITWSSHHWSYLFERREASACLINMLSATGTIFNFGMTRPELESAPPASEANTLTITLSGPVNILPDFS